MIATIYSLELDEKKHPVLQKEKEVSYEKKLTRSDYVVHLCEDVMHLSRMAEEHVVMVSADSKGEILGIFPVSHGAVNSTICNPREIYIRALVTGATGIFVVHNHPSGCCTPSKDDLNVAKRIEEVGNYLGLKLFDYIIIGRGEFYSAREAGQIEA